MKHRVETRRERYDRKLKCREVYPISVACVHFMHDGNLGYLIRSAACFGAECIHVIGAAPSRKICNPLSGSLFDYVKIQEHASPFEFINYCNDNKIRLVCAELSEDSKSILSYSFNFD